VKYTSDIRGKTDTVFGDLIIEFKVSVERDIEQGRTELIKYFQAFIERYPSKKFIGVITDNLKFEIISCY
jgi:hypothetical protein